MQDQSAGGLAERSEWETGPPGRGRGLLWAGLVVGGALSGAHLSARWPGRLRPSLGWSVVSFEAVQMGTLPERKDIPPWVKAPEDLKDPEVLQVQTQLLEAMFGE